MAENRYVTKLADTLAAMPDVAQWRFLLKGSSGVSAGIESNRIANPYAPLTHGERHTADVYVVWKDDRVSRETFGPQHFMDVQRSIREMQEIVYSDPDAASVAMPSSYLPIQVYDPAVAALLDDPRPLFEMLSAYAVSFRGLDREIDADVHASIDEVFLRSSTGMNAGYKATRMGTSCELDSRFFEDDTSLKLISPDRIRKIADYLIGMFNASERAASIDSGETSVLFSPNVTRALMKHYLTHHFSASAVIGGSSRYSDLDDFARRKQVMVDGLSLVVDGSKDFRDVPFDAEGIAGRRHVLVQDGRLRDARMDQKWAQKLGKAPSGPGKMYLETERAVPLNDLVRSISDGILVQEVLGIHTGDQTTGTYSLQVPIGHRIIGGEIVGLCRANVAGNFFDDLSNPQVRFATHPLHEEELGFLVRRKVDALKE